jgi:hypothetical protein
MAFVTVCVLLGAALGMVGLHTYSLIDELRRTTSGISEPEILAAILRDILLDAGTLLGLAGASSTCLRPPARKGQLLIPRLTMSPEATGGRPYPPCCSRTTDQNQMRARCAPG